MRPHLPRWLYPGMHLKRWLLLVFLGIVILGLGGAVFLLDVYRGQQLDEVPFFYVVTGAGLDRPVRAAILGAAGLHLHGARRMGPDAERRLAVRPAWQQRDGGALHQALPGPRSAHRGDRRGDRPLDAPSRPQGVQREHHRRGRGGRRWRFVRPPAPAARHRAAGRHPQLHRRSGRRRAAHDAAHAVPIPIGLRPRRPRVRQPVHRRHDRGHRRLRGGSARVEPRARGARPGAAGDERAAEPVGAARQSGAMSTARSPSRRRASRSSTSSSSRRTCAPTPRRSNASSKPR